MGLAIAPATSTATLDDLKDRLNKTLTVDDIELQNMLDAAVAYYTRVVGPITTKTKRYDGGSPEIVLPPTATGVTGVAYTDGSEVDTDSLYFDEDTQILSWGYTTSGPLLSVAGIFTYGSRNVVVTFTTGIPADHREIILADVAGYFSATQRGGGVGPSFSAEGYEAPFVVTAGVITLWPRIDNLSKPNRIVA